MSAEYRTIYEPEDPPPPPVPHVCKPVDYRGSNKPKYKDRSIIECIECGKFWWASVFVSGTNTFMDPKQYNIFWTPLRWYHFKLRRHVR